MQGALVDAGSRRKYGFSLTPLADIMFQLLIFFMLSSSLAPYALLPLQGTSAGDVEEAQTAKTDEQSKTEAPVTAAWHLSNGNVRIGKTTYALEDLSIAVKLLTEQGAESVILFTARTAMVQDLTSVLEALATNGITNVQLIGRPGSTQ